MTEQRNYWSYLGKVAFVFAVLWFFDLLYNFMFLGMLGAGFMLFLHGTYRHFKHSKPLTDEQKYYEKLFKEKQPMAKEILVEKGFLRKFEDEGGEKTVGDQ